MPIQFLRGLVANLASATPADGQPVYTTDQPRLYVGYSSVKNLVGVLRNIAATAAPTVNDDSADGYSPDSTWTDVTNDKSYVCVDATVGAAVWIETTQASSSIQTLLDGISTTQGVVLYYNGTDWVSLGVGTAGQVLKTGGAAANPSWLGSANVISLLAAADYAAMRALLDLEAGTDFYSIAAADAAFQPKDATLTALAAANWAENALPIGTGADTLSQTSFAANTFPARASTGNLVAKTISDDGLTFLAAANQAAMRAAIGAGTGSGNMLAANNLSDVASASTSRSNLGLAYTTQSIMETGTALDSVVLPGLVQYHPGVAKCFCSIDQTGTQAILTSHNITSIADGGVGFTDVTIATDFSSANWVCVMGAQVMVGTSASVANFLSKAAGTISIRSYNTSSAALDTDILDFAGFGDQA